MPLLTVAFRLALAVVIGSLLGYERERIGKPAGMRTYALVAFGATFFTLMSQYGFGGMGSMDPTRIASQIVIGIGFIGGGLIMRQEERVRGLTTAAGLWAIAAIGMAIGVGWWREALIATVIVFLVLVSSQRFSVPTREHHDQ